VRGREAVQQSPANGRRTESAGAAPGIGWRDAFVTILPHRPSRYKPPASSCRASNVRHCHNRAPARPPIFTGASRFLTVPAARSAPTWARERRAVPRLQSAAVAGVRPRLQGAPGADYTGHLARGPCRACLGSGYASAASLDVWCVVLSSRLQGSSLARRLS
jgi:hypothetical protein